MSVTGWLAFLKIAAGVISPSTARRSKSTICVAISGARIQQQNAEWIYIEKEGVKIEKSNSVNKRGAWARIFIHTQKRTIKWLIISIVRYKWDFRDSGLEKLSWVFRMRICHAGEMMGVGWGWVGERRRRSSQGLSFSRLL